MDNWLPIPISYIRIQLGIIYFVKISLSVTFTSSALNTIMDSVHTVEEDSVRIVEEDSDRMVVVEDFDHMEIEKTVHKVVERIVRRVSAGEELVRMVEIVHIDV